MLSVMPVPIFLFQKELVLQAVQKDQEGERSAALSLYCAALEHFVPAIHCKNNNHFMSCLWLRPFDNALPLFNRTKLAKVKTPNEKKQM